MRLVLLHPPIAIGTDIAAEQQRFLQQKASASASLLPDFPLPGDSRSRCSRETPGTYFWCSREAPGTYYVLPGDSRDIIAVLP